MSKNNISLVVPTYNMSDYLESLFDSIYESGLYEFIDSIIVVNDGSTDNTLDLLNKVISKNYSKIKIVNLGSNKGRFLARYYGSKEARTERILFLDSRNKLGIDFVDNLKKAAKEYENIIGSVDIDIEKNLFCLYWDRTHKFIFKKHYSCVNQVVKLTPENYDDYLKGTTVFLTNKELFVTSCEKFLSDPLLNDDTYLMKDMVQSQPLFIHPDVRINWVPRENYNAFFSRLFERGPSFVEYHIFEKRGLFFFIVMASVLLLIFLFILSFFSIKYVVYISLILLLIIALSTAIFAKSIKEFILLMPLHIGTIISFGSGILFGLGVNLKKYFKKKLFEK